MNLRSALKLNAVFSFAIGTLLTVAPSTTGTWLGVEIDGWLRLLGVALVGHGVALVWAQGRANVGTWTRFNVAMIAPYPLLMIGLVVAGVIPRDLGKMLALADGAIVGALAVAQFVGLRNPSREAHPQHA